MRINGLNVVLLLWALLWAIIGLTLSQCAGADERLHPEAYYRDRDCKIWGGVAEYRVPNDPAPSTPARVDCLTATLAVEFDYADKWAEGVGQALYYARMTERRPALALIIERDDDTRYLVRAYAAFAGAGRGDWLVLVVRP